MSYAEQLSALPSFSPTASSAPAAIPAAWAASASSHKLGLGVPAFLGEPDHLVGGGTAGSAYPCLLVVERGCEAGRHVGQFGPPRLGLRQFPLDRGEPLPGLGHTVACGVGLGPLASQPVRPVPGAAQPGEDAGHSRLI